MKVSARAVRIKDVRDGGDVEDGIRLGQRVIAGVVAERAFVAERLARVNVAFDDEVGVGQNGFQVSANSAKQIRFRRSNFKGMKASCSA